MNDLIDRQVAIECLDDDITITGEHNALAVQDYVRRVANKLRNLPSAEPEIIRCKDCKFSHMTVNGECKYCDIWFPDEKCYIDGDYFCGSAERRTDD